ncbi:PEP/pyruvate-binding domain-containing protein [Mycobacterium sp. GA-1199]|uniref:PEP/pyruvate-binding domain-containing protein n=1 Tax=Mycobacterium sp. GA-1199 TaxID=1772287 RepID=UPI000ABA2EBA|nr:PEP/pyruvate-binding domain-containing protein [Mycobacterium sp. GA-1199]
MIKIVDAPTELADASLVGHKFARQQRLRDAGVRVPPFFCVIVESPWVVIADVVSPFPGVDAGVERLTAWAETARSAAERMSLTPEIQAAIRQKYIDLAVDEVAVRACVVGRDGQLGEDDAADAFAGLTDSYLYVRADALMDRVSDCVASVFSVKSVLYRAQRGIDPSILGVSVGVQQMIDGQSSFVAFTHDPVTGSRGTKVAAAYGIGEGVVAERADIDHFFFGPGGIEKRISHKQRMLCRAPTGGVAEYRVPDHLADKPVLSDVQIDQIATLAEIAERIFRGPQDMEGVVTADSAVHMVQVRPAVRPRNASLSVEWTNHNLTESFPGVTTAMTYSHARAFYRMSFRDFYRTVGVSDDHLRSREHHLRRMVGYLDGRLYYRLDAWYALHSHIPGWEVLRPVWERSLGLHGDSPGLLPALDRGAGVRLLALVPRLVWVAVRFPRRLRDFLAWWDDQHTAGMELAQLPADEIVATYRRVWAEAERHWGVTILASYLGLAVYAASILLAQRWTRIAEVNLAALLPGGPPNRTLESVHSMVAIAERINAIPGLSERVMTGDPGETWKQIESGRYSSKLAADIVAHLRTFGDRAMNDLKIEEPTPRQRPEMLIDSLRPFVAAGATMQQTSLQEASAARGALDELRRICPSRFRRAILKAALRAARFLAKAREDTRFCRTQLYGFSREAMRRLGADLAAAGWLDSPDDYVHLEAEELLGAFEGTSTIGDLRGLARARKEAFLQACSRSPLASRFETATLPIDIADLRRSAANTPAGCGPSTVLSGLPSSAGIARAQAKLVLHPHVRPDECAGRILVALETDPGWLPLMLNAAGLVAERGSMLSHTAITGRMLGVPTIVAVSGATTTIADGDEIEIDGRSGIVRIFHRD